MKKTAKLFAISLVLIMVLTSMVGCGEKKKTVTYDAEVATISLSYPEKANYTYTENKEELKSNMNVAGIKGENFEIDIRVSTVAGATFEETMNRRYDMYKDSTSATAVRMTIGGFETVGMYYNNYYSISIPLKDKEYAELLVYGDGFSNEKIKAAYELPEVQDILKSVVVTVK